MNPLIFILTTLADAVAMAFVAMLLGAALLVSTRVAMRMAGGAAIGSAVSFAGTSLAMAPFYPDTPLSAPVLLAGLAGGLLCAVMIYRLSRRKPLEPS